VLRRVALAKLLLWRWARLLLASRRRLRVRLSSRVRVEPKRLRDRRLGNASVGRSAGSGAMEARTNGRRSIDSRGSARASDRA